MFCPTGGVNEENASKWIDQPNVICVGGSWLTSSNEDDYREITRKALIASNLNKK